jgi:xanthine dehydrogenase YagS FAD-binding subunit
MRPFAYYRPTTVDQAVQSCSEPGARFLAGGTNLVDLLKMGSEQASTLIDITRLGLDRIEEHAGGLRIGALAKNSVMAADLQIRRDYPLLSQALLAGASPQLRNMATAGGNLLQRTRCYYFYDPTFIECNKRNPGSGCAAINGGINRLHAILGASDRCIATHPSDMAVALAALDAVVRIKGPRGDRSMTITEFYRLPGQTPQLDNNLRPGELITSIDLPPSQHWRSTYLKVRDRNSYAFALVSAAVLLNIGRDGKIADARVALGGVAHKPWRSLGAEHLLRGKEASATSYADAARLLVEGARPLNGNAFKVELAKRTVVRALTTVASA